MRQRGIIVGPIEEFRKELSARFEEIGRDKWPRAVLRLMREQELETVEELRDLCERGSLEGRSSRKKGEENHQDDLIWFKKEKDQLEVRIRVCETEKLNAEKKMREAQRACEKVKTIVESLKDSLQQATRELKRLRRYGRANQCLRCGGVGHVVRQCTSRPVQRMDTTKKARKAIMVEPVKILGQGKRFEAGGGSVVSVMFTSGWERLKTRCPELKKEAEVLAKPYLIEPSQSDAKIVARAEACLGQAMCRDAEKKCVPTNQCSKSEEMRRTRVVTNRVFIKRNHGIGVGSRSGAKCTPKAAQAVVGKIVECKNRWVPREQTRCVPGVQMKAKRGKREVQRRTVNCARRNVKSNFNVEDMELSLRRTLAERHDGVYTVKADRDRLPNSFSASETIDSMESLADCRGMAVPEHESGTSRRRSRSPSGKESRRDVDTLLRARAGRMPRHHY
uniref:CCHC-type domain-containing protein n=1 Tax=Caenorhabditis japonica TaxID=281687 RepID=A0A8R1HFV0_CAEJA